MEYMESTYDDFDDKFFMDLFDYDALEEDEEPAINHGLADGQKWESRCGEIITLSVSEGSDYQWFVGAPGGMVYSNTEEFGLKVLGAHANDDYDLMELVE